MDRSRPSGERRLLSRRSGDRRLSLLSDDLRLRSRDRLRRLSPGLGDLRRYLAGLLRGGLLSQFIDLSISMTFHLHETIRQ